jgi:ATP-dependent DNA helicase RecQ
LDLARTAVQAGLPYDAVERRLLEWMDRGWLEYRPSGRDMLLSLPPPPPDASARIATLLERYETVRMQRVHELSAYAETQTCRHGYINAYLGGRAIHACTACDNCVPSDPVAETHLLDQREQLLTAMRCVSESPWSWGRRTLVRILRGSTQERPRVRPLHPRACANPWFGALAFRSTVGVQHLLEQLEHGGLLQARKLQGDGIVLDLTSKGRAALQDPVLIDGLLNPQKPDPPDEQEEHEPAMDRSLFDRLRSWRLEQARARKVPPYCIFHDSLLQAVATHLPVTLDTLAELKGVGPRKLKRYGDAVIEIVRDHISQAASNEHTRH